MSSPKNQTELSDHELDQLLQTASHPQVPADFEAKLLARMNAAAPMNNVVAFPARRKTPVWITSLPLAASLILGLWLGTSDQASSYLPFSTEAVTQSISALLPSDGTTTLYSLTEDTQS